jgi:hypothetical protein
VGAVTVFADTRFEMSRFNESRRGVSFSPSCLIQRGVGGCYFHTERKEDIASGSERKRE